MNTFSKALLPLVLLLSVGSSSLNAQDLEPPRVARFAVYSELLGQGFLYSLNFDYLVADNLSLRAGYSRWSFPSGFMLIDGDVTFTSFPLMLNYLSGEGNSRLELGVGLLPLQIHVEGHEVFFESEVNGEETFYVETATIGYRYQQIDGGFLFRIGLTPFYYKGNFATLAGISIGAGF